MWTRAQIKTNAKAVMSRNYWQMLGVSVIYTLIGGAVTSSTPSTGNMTLNFSDEMSIKAMVMIAAKMPNSQRLCLWNIELSFLITIFVFSLFTDLCLL